MATRRYTIYRHFLPVRITHWVNVLCLTILLMSGLQIFNAHPALYWGQKSDFEHPFVSIGADPGATDTLRGAVTILGYSIPTTGVLGISENSSGRVVERGFPTWATLPSDQDLSTGRLWHFFFAWLFVLNGLAYLLYALFSGHVWRDLIPSRAQWRHLGAEIWDHLRLRFPKGEEARHYNLLQKLAYLVVIFGLLPLVILAGFTMSPQLDAAFPFLLDLFGGRQSARTLHFLAAFGLLAFVIIHLLMVLVSGLWNNLRSMITGRYSIEAEASHER